MKGIKNVVKTLGLAALVGLGSGLFSGCGKYDGGVCRNLKIVGVYKDYLNNQRLKITKINYRLGTDEWMIEDPADSTKSISFNGYLDSIKDNYNRAIEKAFLYKTADSLDAQLKK